LPRGRRVAIVGNAGGSLGIAADAARWAELDLADVSDDEGLQNPWDLGLTATAEAFTDATARLAAHPGVDAVLVLYAPSLGGSPAEVREALDAAQRANPEVPVAACFYGPDLAIDENRAPGRVPVYDAIDAAARAMGRAAEYAAWRA